MIIFVNGIVIIRSSTAVGSAPVPPAVQYLVDENGNYITDENGNRIVIPRH
jgi:hypothetical protein